MGLLEAFVQPAEPLLSLSHHQPAVHPCPQERHAGMLTLVPPVVQLAPSAGSPSRKEAAKQVAPGMSPMERFLAMDISAMAEAQAHAMEVSLMQPAHPRFRPSMGMAVQCNCTPRVAA